MSTKDLIEKLLCLTEKLKEIQKEILCEVKTDIKLDEKQLKALEYIFYELKQYGC